MGDELAGDRAYADDKSYRRIVIRLDGRPVMIIGHQKGRETKEKFAVTLVHASARRLPQSTASDANG